jgi:hypothetical protein
VIVVPRRIVLGTLSLLLAAAVPAAAQHPGSNATDLPPLVREQLWPTQHLSRPKQELKQRTLVARDTLTQIESDVSLIRRQRLGSPAVLASTARSLVADCQRGGRTAKWLASYATSLSTSDNKWGAPAVRDYRAGIAQLERGMAACSTAVTRELQAKAVDPDRLMTIAKAAHASVAEYRRTEEGLLKTLNIKIDPREKAIPDSL